jgi:hypothetical protein
MDYYQRGNTICVAELLETHLPANIRQWKEAGLPALSRARDS